MGGISIAHAIDEIRDADWYWDRATKIRVREQILPHIQLEVGEVYHLHFNDGCESSFYEYMVVKRDGYKHWLVEYDSYHNEAETCEEKHLMPYMLPCDVKELLGIDLTNLNYVYKHKHGLINRKDATE